jgi:hypothetical protein
MEKKMRARDNDPSVKWGTDCTPLDIISKDDKQQKRIISDLQGVFFIIQSDIFPG